ncbi:MAG: MOSC domain-containing protein [Singulisphaera sp.]
MAIPPMFSLAEMEACLDHICDSPRDTGTVELIVRRPRAGEREVVSAALLDVEVGLVGDNWLTRGSRHTPDGSADATAQLTLMNARAIAAIATAKDAWPLAGDQLFVDFDLSDSHLPPGTRLQVGSALIEVTATPHTGCKLFAARFGVDAVKFVNSPRGKQLHLRGINARIVRSGEVRVGDKVEMM